MASKRYREPTDPSSTPLSFDLIQIGQDMSQGASKRRRSATRHTGEEEEEEVCACVRVWRGVEERAEEGDKEEEGEGGRT